MAEKDWYWYETARKILIEDKMEGRLHLLNMYYNNPVRVKEKLLDCDTAFFEKNIVVMYWAADGELSDEQKRACPELAKEIEAKSATMRQTLAAVKDVYRDAIQERWDKVKL